jgi:hypothetical protein
MDDNRQEVRGVRVNLSHESFSNTDFDGCELVFDGQPTELVDVRFNACSFSFVGPAANTLDFLRMLCANDAEFAQQLGRDLGILAVQTH